MAKRKKDSAGSASTEAAMPPAAATEAAVGDRAAIHITEACTVELGDLSDADGDAGSAAEMARKASEQLREHYAGLVVLIEVPLGPPPGDEESCPRHVDLQLRSAYNRAAMRRLLTGLDLSGARLADGNRVTTYVQALIWLLEQLKPGMILTE